jgi:small-conductance mechanosensitive channel
VNFVYINLIQSVLAISIVLIIDFLIEYFIVKKISGQRKAKKIKGIVRNVLIVSLIIFLAKIWIDGFGHFLAFVGFISAALTITQKENILNLMGGFIIMWRDAFAEGDYVKIKEYSGVVKNLGIFYFTLEETKYGLVAKKTGNFIKVPNHYVSIYPFSIYSFEDFISFEKKYVFKFSSDIKEINGFSNTIQSHLKSKLTELSAAYTGDVKKEYGKLIAKNKYIEPSVELSIVQNELKGFMFKITGLIDYKNEYEIHNYLDGLIIEFSQLKNVKIFDGL